jgi:serine O-acetyltransferase
MPFEPRPEFLERLQSARRGYALPYRAQALARDLIDHLLALLFPHYATERRCQRWELVEDHGRARAMVATFVSALPGGMARAEEVADAFMARLPAVYDALLEDATATCEADPAARSVDEVIGAYPGFLAIACHRLARELHVLGVDLLPRMMTEVAHRRTGVDIHPGAALGRALSIDHGTGIVIGETTVIGDRVRLYQGVTLGALSVRKTASHARRHPTLEDDVIVYANATILGGDTVVGAGSVIGGNVWLTHSVPPGSIVTEVAGTERRLAESQDPSRPG